MTARSTRASTSVPAWYKRIPWRIRLGSFALASLAMAAAIFFLWPNMFKSLIAKPPLVTFGVVLGYIADRVLFPASRPMATINKGNARRHAEYRRAIIVSVCILVMGFGA